MRYQLTPHRCKDCAVYAPGDPRIPAALAEAKPAGVLPSDLPVPLPFAPETVTCCLQSGGVWWIGGDGGVLRYDPQGDAADRCFYFSAPRDLPDGRVEAMTEAEDGVFVRTATGAAKLAVPVLGAEEKAERLLRETLSIVDRRGMVSQRALSVPRALSSHVPYGHSDNDGGFTAMFAAGELFRYATLRREKGADAPETLAAQRVATRAVEACLLLFFIHGRGDGFLARTYLCSDEPVPDDGLFFRRQGKTAVCLDTTEARERGCVGLEIPCGAPVPDRLAALYREGGYTDDDIIYKADTSSDEVTLQFMMLRYAHDFLDPADPELGALIRQAVTGLLDHVMTHGRTLHDFHGGPTTWAKWNPEYFMSECGWADACINAAQLLMYHQIVMHITGEQGRWRESHDRLIAEGYAELPQKHYDRLYQLSLAEEFDIREEIMYGDHMLAVASLWQLCELETDPALLALYRKGLESWRSSIAPEHNPGYDLPYLRSCPGAKVDFDRLALWFYRTNVSRLAAGVKVCGRRDVPVRVLRRGQRELSVLLPPDERFISKYDRDPLKWKDEDSGGVHCVESCYIYTFAYWMGRYFDFFC